MGNELLRKVQVQSFLGNNDLFCVYGNVACRFKAWAIVRILFFGLH